MKIALLGATGFVGSALLKEALDRGHSLTAIVRHPEKLEKRDGLTAKAGDVYDTSSLATLIQGNDAIISAFNPGWKDPNLYDDQVRGTASIIAAIRKSGIKRGLWVVQFASSFCCICTVRNCNHLLVRRRPWRSQSPSERPCRNMCISNSKRDADLRRPVRSKRWATRLMIPKTQIGVLIGSRRRDYQRTSMAARVDGQR